MPWINAASCVPTALAVFAALRVHRKARVFARYHPPGEAMLVDPLERPGEFAGLERREHDPRAGGDPPRVDRRLEELLQPWHFAPQVVQVVVRVAVEFVLR